MEIRMAERTGVRSPVQKMAERQGVDFTRFRREMRYRDVSDFIIRKVWNGEYLGEGDSKLSTLRKAAEVLGCDVRDLV